MRNHLKACSLALLVLGLAGPVQGQQQWKLGSLMQPPTFGATPAHIGGPAPALGQHTAEVLAELDRQASTNPS